MRAFLLVADHAGCGHYRMKEPARVLQGEIDITLDDEVPTEASRYEAEACSRLTNYDVIVVQRPVARFYMEMIPFWQSRGIAVVVELDDDVGRLHTSHPGYAAYNGKQEEGAHWRNMQKAAAMADWVTVTTPLLAERYAPHGRVSILPNCVPESMLELPRCSDEKTIGWTGAVFFHPGDLEITYGGVNLALEECPDWHFRKIGGGAEIVQRGLSLKDRPEQTGPKSLEDYFPEIPQLDVGIVPLAPTRFNAAKSYLKGIEYAACGIPFVASEVADYVHLHDEYGLGILCKDKGRSWKAACKLLMTDDNLREELAQVGKETVREHHTYERNAWEWAESWADAIATRHRRMKTAV